MQDVKGIIDNRAVRNIVPYPIEISSGRGWTVFDEAGREYLDMVSAVAVCNFGHGHPRLLRALREQSEKICLVPRIYYNEALASMLDRACRMAKMDRAIPMNSGAEAVETAIKAARKWAYRQKGIERGKAEIIVCDDNFHGRTISTVSMSSVSQYKEDFRPLTPGFRRIPFNDIAGLEEAINENTAAFIVEPIQGEAGVLIPSDGYLSACEKICRAENVLFICDEIQTGMGRTGDFLALEHDGIQADAVLMGKALGGGILPISLFLARGELSQVLEAGDHGSTFGGNPLASRVADEALQLLVDDKLIEQAEDSGQYFLSEIERWDLPLLRDVRGRGCMIAIALDVPVNDVLLMLAEKGLLVMPGRQQTIRLLPPLTIDRHSIDKALSILYSVLRGV